jgi:hypothetical protein
MFFLYCQCLVQPKVGNLETSKLLGWRADNKTRTCEVSVLILFFLWHGVSKGVDLGCSPPAMRIATSAGGHLKVVSGMAAHRALKGRAWCALAML